MPEARAPLPHTQGLGESPLAPAAGSRTLTVPACRQAAQKRGRNRGAGDRLVPQEARPSPLGVGAGGLRTPKARAHEARTPPAPWAPGGRVSTRRPQPTPLAACRVATPRRLRCRRGRATERVCGERGSRSHGDGRRGFRGEGRRWPCRRTPRPCPARPDTLRESKHVQDSCSWTGMLCGSAPRPRTSPNSWLHGAFRGQPCSLCSDTGYRSLPCRSEGSPLPGSPRGLPLVRPAPARVAQCPLWVPGLHGGLRPPFHLHTESEALCPCPQGSAQEPHAKPLPASATRPPHAGRPRCPRGRAGQRHSH